MKIGNNCRQNKKCVSSLIHPKTPKTKDHKNGKTSGLTKEENNNLKNSVKLTLLSFELYDFLINSKTNQFNIKKLKNII